MVSFADIRPTRQRAVCLRAQRGWRLSRLFWEARKVYLQVETSPKENKLCFKIEALEQGQQKRLRDLWRKKLLGEALRQGSFHPEVRGLANCGNNDRRKVRTTVSHNQRIGIRRHYPHDRTDA